MTLKKKYPDAILMIEVGYKYRFFGDDARVSSVLALRCLTPKFSLFLI